MKAPAPHRPAIALESLGCAKNTVDSERILGRLASAGAVVGVPPDEADIIIVNTCGFIQPAKEESIERILSLAAHKTEGRCSKLIVMGCLAERYAGELKTLLPEADAIIGLGREEAILRACGFAPGDEQAGRLLLTPPYSGYLRVSEGCDNCCAYCAIPLIRGPFRSWPFDAVVSEAEALVAGGVRELNVIGQDTTSYGTGRRGGRRLPDLLAALAAIRDLRWLRLLYTHPAHFDDALMDAYAALPKLVPYVDLPVQHLNDAILKRMGRGVTRKRIEDLVARLRERVPGVAIRTTFIVGFPGETRAQFREMLEGVSALRFDYAGCFTYSREEGTRAAKMRGQVSEQAKSRRHRELMLAQQEVAFEKNRERVGRRVEVVVEATGREEGVWTARATFQAPDVDSVTFVRGAGLRIGEFRSARITGWKDYDLLAETARG